MPDLTPTSIYILGAIYLLVALALAAYASHAVVILGVLGIHSRRSRKVQRMMETDGNLRLDQMVEWPDVVTQLPLYNEANVAERVIRAAAAMRYPGRHRVQILDDSNDETCAVVDRVAADLRRAGCAVDVVRRSDRVGYKAGALKVGMEESSAPFLAVFDADFIAPDDFLLRTVPVFFGGERVGFVQGRWTFLNERDSFLTRAQGVGLDSHFGIEQDARSSHPAMFINFNGTAGIWRREAIEAAGGWSADTLTEDLDLSYRVQLAGWSGEFLADLEVPGELPSTFSGYKSQQFRWAKGSMQTALKLLPTILRSEMRPSGKAEAVFHLTHYAVHPLLLVLVLLAPLIAVFGGGLAVPGFAGVLLVLAAISPPGFYAAGQVRLHGDWIRRLCWLPVVTLTGMGVAASNTRAIFEALVGRHSAFIRTPKRGDRETRHYRVKFPVPPEFEFGLGLYALAGSCLAMHADRIGIAQFCLLSAIAFLIMGGFSLLEKWRVEGLGRGSDPSPSEAKARRLHSRELASVPTEVSARPRSSARYLPD